jgi:hypothetical protein
VGHVNIASTWKWGKTVADFENDIHMSFLKQRADKALLRRMERLGVDPDNPPEKHRKVSWEMQRSSKKRLRLLDRLASQRPELTPFSSVMTYLAQTMPHAAGPYRVQPLFPGLSDLSRFMRSVTSEKAHVWTPWPVQQHLYLTSDFDKVRKSLRGSQPDALAMPPEGPTLDFAPISEKLVNGMPEAPSRQIYWPVNPEIVDLLIKKGEVEQGQRDACIQNGAPLKFYDLGSRIASDREGVHIMTMYALGNDLTAQTLKSALTDLGAVFSTGDEFVPVIMVVRTSLDRESGTPEISWFACQGGFGSTEESGYGFSSKASENRMYNDAQMEMIQGLMEVMLPLFERNVEVMYLPAYFDLRVEAVENLDPKEAAQKVASGEAGPTISDGGLEKANKSDKSPSRFKVVKALIRPTLDADGLLGEIASGRSRAAPDEQVEVDGFWRRISENTYGKDPQGNPVLGRTWVRAHRRYTDKPEPKHPKIRVKQPVAPYIGAE